MTNPPSDNKTNSPNTQQNRYYVLGLLLVVYIFNFADRQILSILLESIKKDLVLTDTQLGLLGGIAFAIFYTTVGIPLARMADNGVRRTILAACLAIWSLMTAVGGLANNFWQMLLARIGVGIGEAGCSPPAHSMISDLFGPKERATALSIFALGVPLGTFLGFAVGGWVDENYGWRAAFFALGLPGVLLAVLVMLTLKEPIRGLADGAGGIKQDTPPLKEVFTVLWGRKSFRHLSFAASLHAFVGYGIVLWLPAFFIRTFDVGSSETGLSFGVIYGLGAVGTIAGGFLADRLAKKDRRWLVWVPGYSTLLSVPFIAGTYLSSTPNAALLFFIIPAILGPMYLGPSFALTQSLVNLRMRAVASSILLFIINIIGLGIGPFAIGFLSDYLEPTFGNESLKYALLSTLVIYVWSTLHYLFAGSYLRADLDQAASELKASTQS